MCCCHFLSLQLSFLNSASAGLVTLLWSPATVSRLVGLDGVGVGVAVGVGEAEPDGVGVADEVGFGVDEAFGEVEGVGEDDASAIGSAPAACPLPPDLLGDDLGDADPVGAGLGDPVGSGDGIGVGTVVGAAAGNPAPAFTPCWTQIVGFSVVHSSTCRNLS